MNSGPYEAITTFLRVYGKVAPPEEITQEAFEGDRRHLQRLVRLKPGEQAELHDLWEYLEDVRYTKIQGPLLAFALPFCMRVWHDDLRGISNGGSFVENLYPFLADRKVFEEHLSKNQTAAVSEFMQQAILDEVEEQRGLKHKGAHSQPYRWIRGFTSFGVLLPDVEKLMTEWLTLKTIGRSVAALQYVSCLMYPENENPIFAPWTPNDGGGPPCLWEFEGHLYSHRWLEPNIAFLKQTLQVANIEDVVRRAVERLEGQPEISIAKTIQEDLPLLGKTLEARCGELPRLLETVEPAEAMRQWSI